MKSSKKRTKEIETAAFTTASIRKIAKTTGSVKNSTRKRTKRTKRTRRKSNIYSNK
jgi:hypothetical protein